MRRRILVAGLIGIAGLAALAFVGTSPASATDTLVILVDTTLTEDHDGNIEINANGVTLDCDGHTITGTGGGLGINITGRADITVENCIVVDFTMGIHVSNSSNIILSDNSITGSGTGFFVGEGSTGVSVRGNFAENNPTAYNLDASNGNEIIGNYATGSAFSYDIHESDDNLIEDNYAELADVGILIEDSNNNVIRNNYVTETGTDGAFSFDNSTGNTVEGNTAFVNGANGFHLFGGSVNNDFIGNAAHLHGDVGFRDSTAGSGDKGTGNTYTDNICLRNTNGGSVPVTLCSISGTFFDDDGSTFEFAIEWLAAEGITKGCNPPSNTKFCPDDNVTRGQMAAFLVRALGYTDDRGGNIFIDTIATTFESAIDKLAVAGVTKGCNPPINNKFCPNDFVTRGQMAAFLVRALDYTDVGAGNLFTDDDGHVFEGAIDKLGTAGVTKGCNPPVNDKFCPNDLVTRGQMAAFLKRALE